MIFLIATCGEKGAITPKQGFKNAAVFKACCQSSLLPLSFCYLWLFDYTSRGPSNQKGGGRGEKPFPFPYKCERVHLRNFFPPPTIISMRSRKAKKSSGHLSQFPSFLPECQFWRYPPPFPSYLGLDHIFLLLLSAFFSLRFWTYYRFPLSPSFSFFSYYLWGERVGREVQNFPAINLPPS